MAQKLRSFPSFPQSPIMTLIWFLFLFTNQLAHDVKGFDSLLQLPRFLEFPTDKIFTRVLNVDDYGDGLRNDTEIFKHVWKMACASLLPTKIVVPAGNSYTVGQIDFGGPCVSSVTLRISGTIFAPENPDVWEGLDRHKWLYFHGVEDLTIEGNGVVNGMGWEWWARSCKINKTNPCQHAPTAMTFHRCSNLKVRHLLLVNSQQMHMAFTNCVKVAASHLSVLAPGHSPNTDGIHISASIHVEVKDSIVRTGDDCISIVSNSSEIRIKNITCGPGHGISIGSLGKSNSWTQVHNVHVQGAVLSNTENGVRIKTWQGGSGFASKITFEDVWMINVSNPIIIDQFYCDSPVPCQNESSAVIVDDVSFVSIRGTSATEEAIRFTCSDVFPCERLYLEDIQLVSDSGGNTSSFCWNARGSSSGPVYPPPCFSSSETLIEQIIPSTFHLQYI